MDQQELIDKMLSINLDGNVIPHSWFKELKKDTGKPDVHSMILLSEFVYWYRPVPVKDEITGEFIGYRMKFKSDKLQRSYAHLEEQFGLSEKQIREALIRLENKGLIKREFRNIVVNRKNLSNVMFIDINPDKVRDISVSTKVRGGSQKGNTLLPKKETPSFPKGKHVYGDYYTEIYKEIVSFLNHHADKGFKDTTPKTQKLIRERLKEGNTVDDFKQVILTKVSMWKNDPDKNLYLRPETLFGNKFEGYLNEKVPENKKSTGGFAQFAKKGDDPSDKE
ncbi:conserved phage C-terminal domain-containing protein [Paenalkalicoccus suaedae]|uniref:Conserved phage C-terminal domain-containing protein n=1 Tax=Paenalkalicoccus suaedae TaxID=2592382 RepID=A0A859FBR4_9BACI|nr:conserved phage C-terminal domain-containing protein [Paenalkalicoccus suaedae]QKS70222.1 conserved phage C-terminal domain-containing protein [Paenalkalicoccus suaedae]